MVRDITLLKVARQEDRLGEDYWKESGWAWHVCLECWKTNGSDWTKGMRLADCGYVGYVVVAEVENDIFENEGVT